MKAVTHLEKVIAGETSAVTHLEKVIAQEATAVTYTEKVIAGIAPPITHLQKVIAGEARPVTHLEYVWAGGSPPSVQEYTGAVPVTFVADGTPLLDYLISGNTVQSGTPTPDTPIMPQGTGERTGNLFDAATAYGNLYNNGVVSGTTAYVSQVTNYFTDEQIGKQITITIKADKVTATRIYIVTNVSGTSRNSNSIYENNTGILQITVTPQSTSDYWKMSYGSNASNECIISNIMLNSGSTPLPYEPYGYKLDISSANTTTNVYLGEVETTRQIRKFVLTGDESSWTELSPYYTVSADNVRPWFGCICTHCAYNGIIGGNSNTRLWIKQASFPDYQTLAAFKSYLAAQYANGTPVTIWYVLATEQTAVVNEPLMRIGDYADTVSMEQAGVQIPTANGSTTLDVETTVPPSEVYIKYHGEAVATLSALPAEVSSPEATEEVNPEETEETENGSEDVSLQHEFEAIE